MRKGKTRRKIISLLTAALMVGSMFPNMCVTTTLGEEVSTEADEKESVSSGDYFSKEAFKVEVPWGTSYDDFMVDWSEDEESMTISEGDISTLPISSVLNQADVSGSFLADLQIKSVGFDYGEDQTQAFFYEGKLCAFSEIWGSETDADDEISHLTDEYGAFVYYVKDIVGSHLIAWVDSSWNLLLFCQYDENSINKTAGMMIDSVKYFV